MKKLLISFLLIFVISNFTTFGQFYFGPTSIYVGSSLNGEYCSIRLTDLYPCNTSKWFEYFLNAGNTSMTVDQYTGVLSWIPGVNDIGSHTFTFTKKLMMIYCGQTTPSVHSEGAFEFTINVLPPPPPTITSGSYYSNQWVHFSWSSVPGAVSYRVYRTGMIQGTLNEGANNVGSATDVYDYPYLLPTFSEFLPGRVDFASYYVTAIFSDGSESSPSNSIAWGVLYPGDVVPL